MRSENRHIRRRVKHSGDWKTRKVPEALFSDFFFFCSKLIRGLSWGRIELLFEISEGRYRNN